LACHGRTCRGFGVLAYCGLVACFVVVVHLPNYNVIEIAVKFCRSRGKILKSGRALVFYRNFCFFEGPLIMYFVRSKR
jgi:hypothetical protein